MKIGPKKPAWRIVAIVVGVVALLAAVALMNRASDRAAERSGSTDIMHGDKD